MPDKQVIPVDELAEHLKEASLFGAINLGAAYASWRSPCQNNGGGNGEQNKAAGPIYDMYYEAMLKDKAAAMKHVLTWLGHPEVIDTEAVCSLALVIFLI